MKKLSKVLLASVLVLMLAAVFICSASAADDGNITLTFYEDSGTLIVSGAGSLSGDPDYGTAGAAQYGYFDPNFGDVDKSQFTTDDTVKNLIIGSGITRISCCFNYMENLENVILPDTLEEIYSSFSNCPKLKSVTFPESLKSVRENSFSYCDSLCSINFNSPVVFGKDRSPDGEDGECSVFSHLPALKKLYIPGGSQVIDGFMYCTSLTEVVTGKPSVSFGGVYENPRAMNIFSGAASDLTVYATNATAKDFMPRLDEYSWDKMNFSFSVYDYIDISSKSIYLVKAQNTENGVGISWQALEGAEKYLVYRKAPGETVWQRIGECTSTQTGFVDKNVKSGVKYTYTVKAENPISTSKYNKTGLSCTFLSSPQISSVKAQKDGIKVSWSKTGAAEGYIVLRRTLGEKGFKQIADVKAGTLSYLDKSVKSGTENEYRVAAYKGDIKSYVFEGDYCEAGTIYLAQPAPTAKNVNGGVTLSWTKSAGADGYIVYRKAPGETKWVRLAKVTGAAALSYTDKSVKANTVYTYTVKAYKADSWIGELQYSTYLSSGVKTKYLAPCKLTSATAAKNAVTLKWGKVAGADGYRVYRKTADGSYAKIGTVSDGTLSFVDKTAKPGTEYTYIVRSYSGSYVGVYGNTLTCKAK